MVTPARIAAASSLRGDLTVTATPPAVFDPAEWGTVLGDFDASNPASITAAAGRVSSFAPSSGTLAPMGDGGLPNKQPFTGTRTIGGKNALEGQGAHSLHGPSGTVPQPFTVAIVLAVDSLAGNASNYGQAFGDPASIYMSTVGGGNYGWMMYAGGTYPGPPLDLAPHANVCVFNGAASAWAIDGVAYAGGNPGPQYLPNEVSILGAPTSYFLDGIVGQLIYYAGAVADPVGLSAALAHEWAITARREAWPVTDPADVPARA